MSDKFERAVSIYNVPLGYSKTIGICDVTLRDGEQTAGVSFSLDEKVEIASMLDELGIDQIQLGGARTQHDIDVAYAVSKLPRKHSNIEVMTSMFEKNWKKQVSVAVDSGAEVVHSLVPLSPLMRGMYPEHPNDQAVYDRVQETVAFIRESGAKLINISLLDTSRTPQKLIVDMTKLLCDLGVDRIRFADTVGTASPWAISHMAQMMRETIDSHPSEKKPLLLAHIHNDFGLATANALAAVAGGTDMVDLSVNGLGDRCGNADLAQVVIGIESLLDLNTNINVKGLYHLSKEVERISGIPVPRNAPFVGEMSFSVEGDSHTLASFSDPFAYQGIKPETVGNHSHMVVGKKNGPEFLRLKLSSLGMPPVGKEAADLILNAIHEKSESCHGALISDEEFCEIVNRYSY